MRTLLIPTLFLLVACNPLRHYQKVVNDPFRNSKERELLARASQQEFPDVMGDTSQVVTYDSTEYNRLNDEYNELVDAYLQLDSAFLMGTCDGIHTTRVDTIFQKIKALKPATITKTITKEIKVRDGAWAELKQVEVNTCREELRLMTFQKDELKTKKDNLMKILWYMGGFLLVLMVLIIWKPKIPKIFNL